MNITIKGFGLSTQTITIKGDGCAKIKVIQFLFWSFMYQKKYPTKIEIVV